MSGTEAAYHHGDLRRVLVREAARALNVATIADLSLRALAKAARVSPSAPYRHFKDKDALLDAVASEGFMRLADALAANSVATPDGAGDPAGTIRTYLRFARDEPGFYRIMFQSPASLRHQVRSEAAPARRTLSLITTAIGKAVSGLSEDSLRERAFTLVALLQGLVSLEHEGPFDRIGDDAMLERIACAAGLRLMR